MTFCHQNYPKIWIFSKQKPRNTPNLDDFGKILKFIFEALTDKTTSILWLLLKAKDEIFHLEPKNWPKIGSFFRNSCLFTYWFFQDCERTVQHTEMLCMAIDCIFPTEHDRYLPFFRYLLIWRTYKQKRDSRDFWVKKRHPAISWL